jgi:hypothetical protein
LLVASVWSGTMHRNSKDKNDFLSFENRQTWNLICTKKAMMDDRILHLCTCENKHAKERMGSDVQMRCDHIRYCSMNQKCLFTPQQ